MPSSDYKAAVGGGLKLKGASTGAGIDKKKKKKKVASSTENAIDESKPAQSAADQSVASQITSKSEDFTNDPAVVETSRQEARDGGKTEAQRNHDERRRQRLEEKLRREGVHTHKERVEQLNKYLSKMSEHHDMPRIGPG